MLLKIAAGRVMRTSIDIDKCQRCVVIAKICWIAVKGSSDD